MSHQEKLIKLIGTPFIESLKQDISDQELLDLYDFAFENRVALLYLTLYRKNDWSHSLEEKYRKLKDREEKTLDVIARLALKLNEFNKDNYIIFKSIKPYPATPNDTDVIWLGNREAYKKANQYLLANGYVFHEWAPLQKTYFDEKGKNSIGKGKKGGIYYIDFYEEISTDYFAYLNKNILKNYIIRKKINNVEINLLKPEIELAIIMFHNVFPERTFQLEHFFLPLYYFSKNNFDLNLFITFIKTQHFEYAIKSNLTIIGELHQKHFGFLPYHLVELIKEFGINKYEKNKLVFNDYKLPHMFSPKTFWITFLYKLKDPYSRKSLSVQLLKMLNPIFMIDVLKSIKNRLSEEGVYHLE